MSDSEDSTKSHSDQGEGVEEQEDDPTVWKDRTPLTQEKLLSSLGNMQKSIDGKGYGYTKLDLKGNEEFKLTSIGDIIINYKLLSYIDISRNRMKYIDCLSQLDSLIYLRADYNEIEKLPNFTQQYLQMVKIDHNKITTLSDSGSSSIYDLDLSFNLITNLEGLPNFTNLRTVTFSNNQLVNTQNSGQSLSLQKLQLDNNPNLAEIINFDNYPELEEINLTACPLIKFVTGFKSLTKLKKLILESTGIERSKELGQLSSIDTFTEVNLTGSPLGDMANYKVEVLVYSRQIKIIDGEPTTPEELNDAITLFPEREIEDENRRKEEEAEAKRLADEEAKRLEEEAEAKRLAEEEERKLKEEMEAQGKTTEDGDAKDGDDDDDDDDDEEEEDDDEED